MYMHASMNINVIKYNKLHLNVQYCHAETMNMQLPEVH